MNTSVEVSSSYERRRALEEVLREINRLSWESLSLATWDRDLVRRAAIEAEIAELERS